MRLGSKAALVLVFFAVFAHAEPIAQLHATGYVNDFANVINGETRSQLTDLCRQVDEKAHAQIAVVTVQSVDGADIVSYAVELYQKWGIGAKATNRGVLILLAVRDRRYWTSVGYGLEPILPDGKVGGFGREAVPLLRQADYSGAVSLVTRRVADVIARDAGVQLTNFQAPAPEPEEQPQNAPSAGHLLLLVIVILVVLFTPLRRLLFYGLLFGGGGRRGFGGGGWGGGGFGGGGFGGGGFGGFGGGSTGGGGAGGSW